MMLSQSVWTQIWNRLTIVFQELAEQVKKAIPDVTMVIGQSSNANFPFRAYATYTAIQARMPIDVSIDCKLVGNTLSIHADVARESGFVLSEFSSRQIAIHTSSTEAEIFRVFSEIEAYVSNQVKLIGQELT